MEKSTVSLTPQDFANIHVALQTQIDSLTALYKRYPKVVFGESPHKKFVDTQNKIKKIREESN